MIKSVNQSWAISEKLRNRYGKTWAEIDFIFNENFFLSFEIAYYLDNKKIRLKWVINQEKRRRIQLF